MYGGAKQAPFEGCRGFLRGFPRRPAGTELGADAAHSALALRSKERRVCLLPKLQRRFCFAVRRSAAHSAPLRRKKARLPGRDRASAKSTAVRPSEVFMAGSAPAARSSRTVSTRPAEVASCRGVRPFQLRMSTLAHGLKILFRQGPETAAAFVTALRIRRLGRNGRGCSGLVWADSYPKVYAE